MHVSLNEVRTTAAKAAVAAGLPAGVAEEIAHAAAWLCVRDEDGVGAVLAAIGPVADATPPTLREDSNGWRIEPAAVRLVGVSVADILLAEPGRQVLLTEVDAPLLLLGILGQALARVREQGAVSLRHDGGSVLVHAGGLTLDGAMPRAGADVCVTRREGEAAPVDPAVNDGAEVDAHAWEALCARAALTRVPANAASRSHGAGAGDIDNE